jgi:hypothetical protein
LWTKKTAEGILSKMQFAKTQMAEEIFQLYKEGFMRAFSVGFIPKEWTDGDGEKVPRRTYTKWELLEYSAVPVPANPDALALAISKGLLQDDSLRKRFEVNYSETDTFKEEEKQEEIKYSQGDIIVELRSEIDKLNNDNSELKKNIEQISVDYLRLIAELRYKIYLLSNEIKNKENLSEMTDSEIEKKITDIAVGVIRKTTGKV